MLDSQRAVLNKAASALAELWELSAEQKEAVTKTPAHIVLFLNMNRRLDTFCSTPSAKLAWLKAENEALKGRAPLSLITTKKRGLEKVVEYLAARHSPFVS